MELGKLKGVFGVVLAGLVIAGAFFLSPEKERIVRIGHSLPRSHPTHLALTQFADAVEARTNGKYRFRIYPAAALGSESAMLEQLQGGFIQFMSASAGVLEGVADAYGILGIPYLFENDRQLHRAMNAEAVRHIYASGVDAGVTGVTYFAAGDRSFYSVREPIVTPADLRGKCIRAMPSRTSVRMLKMLGARPAIMAYGEVYDSLRHGLLDGAENSERALVDMRHGEVAKHYSLDSHSMPPDILAASAAFWNCLPEADRRVFAECALEATRTQIGLWNAQKAACLEEARTTFDVQFHAVDREAFRSAVRPILDEAMREPAKARIIEGLLASRY